MPNSSVATETKTDFEISENSFQVMPHFSTIEAIGRSRARQEARIVDLISFSIVGVIYPNIGSCQVFASIFMVSAVMKRNSQHTGRADLPQLVSAGN